MVDGSIETLLAQADPVSDLAIAKHILKLPGTTIHLPYDDEDRSGNPGRLIMLSRRVLHHCLVST